MTREIQLTRSKVAVIDDGDYERLIKIRWHCTKFGYAAGRERETGRVVYMHRYILNPPAGRMVDHINGDRLDNRKCNLRICTATQNQQNRRPEGGTSQYKGVHFAKRPQKWMASIRVYGRQKFLGFFPDEITAARVYDVAALLSFGEFARTNFPKENYEWLPIFSYLSRLLIGLSNSQRGGSGIHGPFAPLSEKKSGVEALSSMRPAQQRLPF